MSSTPTQKPSVPLSGRQRRRQKRRAQRQQKLVRAVEAFNEVDAIDEAVYALSRWLSESNIEYIEITGERKPTFADAERYVTAMKTKVLLRYRKSQLKENPSMTDNMQQYRLRSCVRSKISAEESDREQRGQSELTADEETQIIRSFFEKQTLIALLEGLSRFELADRVTDLIEEARNISGEDSVRVAELERLCVERHVDYFYHGHF